MTAISLSAAPDGRTLRLTAEAVGSTSAGLRHVLIGSRAFVEGRTRPGALLIAGGVGVTPIRALLEEEAVGDVVVLHRVRGENDAVLVDEVRHLVADRRGRLHPLTRPRDAGATPFAPDGLRALVPGLA